jgi:hypothetical protein
MVGELPSELEYVCMKNCPSGRGVIDPSAYVVWSAMDDDGFAIQVAVVDDAIVVTMPGTGYSVAA